MADHPTGRNDVPWPQRLLNSIWVLALAAIVFFFLSYVVWGLIDLANTGPAG
ncbi:MAG: hypothetical protein PVF05_09385 [Gemmatimonadales bacterium]|jgi:hypothetical protein